MSFLLFLGLAAVVVAAERDDSRSSWIDRLASEHFREREEATRVLWGEGEQASEALERAARSRDPEMAIRAREILRKIDLGLTPETDPEIVELTERYRGANNQVKSTIFHELRRRRAWRQMLRLYDREDDTTLRDNLARLVDGGALYAARERLAMGDADGAREFLEMARSSPAGMLALAAFHRGQGTINQEIAALGESTDPAELRWLVALHRAAGNARLAAEGATMLRDDLVAAVMRVCLGDPLPWLEHFGQGVHLADEPANLYARAAAARWRGEDAAAERDSLQRLMRSRDEMVRARAMSLMFLLGETELAWDAYVRQFPDEAFLQFDALERPDEALVAMGLDPDAPDYEYFLKSRIARIATPPSGDDNEDDEDMDLDLDAETARAQLIAMSYFLERRGSHELLDRLVVAELLEFAKAHPPRFGDFLSDLFATPTMRLGASELATRVAIAWAAQRDDENGWEDAVVAAFGEEPGYAEWWEMMGNLDPETSKGDRYRGMLALFRYNRDPEKIHQRWLNLAWEALDQADDPINHPMFTQLKFLLGNVVDLQAVDRLVRLGREHDEDVDFLGNNFLIQIAQGRWAEAADFMLLQIASNSENQYEPRADLHAYAAAFLRRAGREDEAEAHDTWAETLALGDPRMNIAIAYAYGYGRDYARSEMWFRRAVMETEPGSHHFGQAIRGYLAELLESRDFDVAAACAEVVAQLDSADQGSGSSPSELVRMRQQAEFTRALSLPPGRRGDAEALLLACHGMSPTDGALADHFFPSLRETGWVGLHDQLFEQSWQMNMKALERFPDADNTMNTAGWLASRANRRLDEARKLLVRALELNPIQPAYLDTLAEIDFASGNRDEAVRLSELALRYMPHDPMILRQHERFLNGPLPR